MHLFDRLSQLGRNDADVEEDLPGGRVLPRQEGQRHVFDADVAVLEPQRLAQRQFQATLGLRGEGPLPGGCRTARAPPQPAPPPTPDTGAGGVEGAGPEGRLGGDLDLVQVDPQRGERTLSSPAPGPVPITAAIASSSASGRAPASRNSAPAGVVDSATPNSRCSQPAQPWPSRRACSWARTKTSRVS
ncbi:MAG: hypothetical protein M3Q48_03945 [Actinomycetota bacterium]|nr:hypothetical protein [Actinomycetota bacterium]